MKKLTVQQRQKAKRIIEQIARQEGKTAEYVRSQMALAIREGWKNAQNDPEGVALWGQFMHDGQLPTPEEFILRSADVIRMMEKPNKKEPLS